MALNKDFRTKDSIWVGGSGMFAAKSSSYDGSKIAIDTRGRILSGGRDLVDIFSTFDLADLTAGAGVNTFAYDGRAAKTISLSGASSLTNGNLIKWSSTNGFENSTLTDTSLANLHTTVNGNSAGWESTESTVNTTSAKWGNGWTTVNTNSAGWESTESTVSATSAKWGNGWTTVNTNSAGWESTESTVNTTSAKWGNGWTTVNTNSAGWENNWTITNANSANWNSVYSSYNDISGNTIRSLVVNRTEQAAISWETWGGNTGYCYVYGLGTAASPIFSNVTATTNLSARNVVYAGTGNSSDWQNTYTTVKTNSADNWDNLIVDGNGTGVGGGCCSTMRKANGNSVASAGGVVFGCCNTDCGKSYNIIAGGYSNLICHNICYASILGGNFNTLNANNSLIVGGYSNNVTGDYNSIIGGCYNTICNGTSGSSIIAGSNITAISSNTAYTPMLVLTNVPTLSDGLAPGTIWSCGGILRIIP